MMNNLSYFMLILLIVITLVTYYWIKLQIEYAKTSLRANSKLEPQKWKLLGPKIAFSYSHVQNNSVNKA